MRAGGERAQRRQARGARWAGGLLAWGLLAGGLCVPPAAAMDDDMREAQERMQGARWSEAAESFERVLRKEPGHEAATFGLGTAKIELGSHAEALALLEPLLARYADQPSLANNVAWILVKTQDPALRDVPRALRLAEDAVLRAPGNFMIWSTLAECYLASGRGEPALRAARLAMRMAVQEGVRNLAEFEDLVRRCVEAAGGGSDGK